jgi:hypothetical protein
MTFNRSNQYRSPSIHCAARAEILGHVGIGSNRPSGRLLARIISASRRFARAILELAATTRRWTMTAKTQSQHLGEGTGWPFFRSFSRPKKATPANRGIQQDILVDRPGVVVVDEFRKTAPGVRANPRCFPQGPASESFELGGLAKQSVARLNQVIEATDRSMVKQLDSN